MRALATLLALTLSTAALAVPMQLTHQGRVDDASGVPLEGVHSVTLSLYADAAGGSPLWTGAMDATFAAGAYALVLGADEANPLPASAFDGSLRYLTLAVDGAPEMAPRLPITSVPYAVRAGLAEVATDVRGGVADVSELRINGTTVIGSDGVLSAPLSYDDLTDVPDDEDTLGGLTCATGEIAVFDGLAWACGAQAPASVDVGTLSGTINIDNLPVGTGSGEVAAGDHTHGFGQITGQAAIGQLPTGTSGTTVALGDHGHVLASLSGDLPIARVTGDLPMSRVTGDLPFSRVSGTAAIGQLPVGTAANQVAAGNHTHAYSAITGSVPNAALPSAFLRSEALAAEKAAKVHNLNGRYFKLYGLEITSNDNAAHVTAPRLNMTATRNNFIGSASFEIVGAPHCGYCYSGGPKAIIYANGNVPYTFYTSGGSVYLDLGTTNALEIRSTHPIEPSVVSGIPGGALTVARMN